MCIRDRYEFAPVSPQCWKRCQTDVHGHSSIQQTSYELSLIHIFFRLLAIRDEWFSDDLKKLDDDRVFLKLQGHWIIEMSEMLATSSAKSIEEIRSFSLFLCFIASIYPL